MDPLNIMACDWPDILGNPTGIYILLQLSVLDSDRVVD